MLEPVEAETVDILSMCGEDTDELASMFAEESEGQLRRIGGDVRSGLLLVLHRLRARGLVEPSPVEADVWQLTSAGTALAAERHR